MVERLQKMIRSLTIQWLGCVFLLVILCGCTRHDVTVSSLLTEMADRQSLTNYPEPEYRLRQASSYNRLSATEGNTDWYANNDMSHFIRIDSVNGRREFVMLDEDGPGAIVRWWMTFYRAYNGIIRIYLDNDTVPVIKGKPDNVLSGNAIAGYPFSVSLQKGAPVGEIGRDYDHNFYFPIPFSKHCKVTYECDSLVMLYEYEGKAVPEGYFWPDVFYNICYREYKPGTRVESFTTGSMEAIRDLIDKTGDNLLGIPGDKKDKETIGTIIAPGDSFSLLIERSDHAIEKVVLALEAENLPQTLRSAVISVSFDGERTVWVPVGEFFGSGYTLQPHSTWMNRSDGKGRMESYWVMPFHKSCRLTVHNFGRDVVSLSGQVLLRPFEWKSSTLYFGACWHEYRNISTRNEAGSFFDIAFANITGKGVYAGDQITLYNPTYEWWGEGDEKFFVDGETFPSIFGTGTEDYYGYSFGRPDAFSHPFLSQPIGAGNTQKGITLNMRHRSLDAVPFASSVRANIELWHWANVNMDYALTTFFYIMPPFTTGVNIDTSTARLPVRGILAGPESAATNTANK